MVEETEEGREGNEADEKWEAGAASSKELSNDLEFFVGDEEGSINRLMASSKFATSHDSGAPRSSTAEPSMGRRKRRTLKSCHKVSHEISENKGPQTGDRGSRRISGSELHLEIRVSTFDHRDGGGRRKIRRECRENLATGTIRFDDEKVEWFQTMSKVACLRRARYPLASFFICLCVRTARSLKCWASWIQYSEGLALGASLYVPLEKVIKIIQLIDNKYKHPPCQTGYHLASVWFWYHLQQSKLTVTA